MIKLKRTRIEASPWQAGAFVLAENERLVAAGYQQVLGDPGYWHLLIEVTDNENPTRVI